MWLNSHIDFNSIKKYARLFLTTVFFLSATSCGNQFTGFANRNTDLSLLASAEKSLRDGNYAGAINYCTYMSAGFGLRPKVSAICASAYAGRAGFSFIGMIDDLALAGVPVMESFLTITASAQDIADANTAISIVRAQGAASVRSNDQNAFMVLLTLWQIAMIADNVGDADLDSLLDGGADMCTDVTAAGFDQELATAFWELYQSVVALQSITYYANLKTTLDALGVLLAALVPSQDFRGAVSPDAFTVDEQKGVFTLLKEGAAIGLDQCTGGQSIATCSCP